MGGLGVSDISGKAVEARDAIGGSPSDTFYCAHVLVCGKWRWKRINYRCYDNK